MPDKMLRWSERALEDYKKLLDYLLEHWGKETTLRIIGQIDDNILRIHNSHEQFPTIIKRKNVRRCVMSPQTSIFFKVDKNEIVIISLFDNRQNPKKQKL